MLSVTFMPTVTVHLSIHIIYDTLSWTSYQACANEEIELCIKLGTGGWVYFLKWLVAFLFTYHFFYWFSPFLQKRKQTYCTWEITNNSSPFLLSCYWGFLWMWMAKAIMYSFFKAYSMETFTAWWVNSTLNFTQNIDIAWNSFVRQWIFL